jgi:hypothetical protein
MSLSQHLVEFRKSLFADLDEAFQKASTTFLNNVVTELVIENNRNYGEILRRLENLEQHSQTRHSMPLIPELFGTSTHLYDVVPDSLSHEEEDANENTMETDSIVCEVVEDSATATIEDETDDADADADAEVVDDDTQPPEENEGEAYDADEENTEEPLDAAEEALQELEVEGETYYYDSAGNVYQADENGEVGEPVGTYDESTGEFELFVPAEEEETETLEHLTYKGKNYLKDSENNVYLEDGSETDFHLVSGKMMRKV